MKTLITCLFALFLTLNAQAETPTQNAEFAAQAIVAAKAIYEVNWGAASASDFAVVEEKYTEIDPNAEGRYKVRHFIDQDGLRTDGGIDFDVRVLDGAVLEVIVDCRMCG